MDEEILSPEQETRAEALYRQLEEQFLSEARRVARLLASKPDEQLLGKTEFQVRERMHKLGAASLQTALEERKKGGTKGPA